MLPTEDLFVYVYTLVDDAIATGAIGLQRQRLHGHPGRA